MKADYQGFGVRLLDEDDLLEVARDHRRRIVEGLQAGRTLTGQPLGQYKAGPRKGQPITLRSEGSGGGALQRGIRASRSQDGAQVESEASYSGHVFERFPEVMQIDADATTDALEQAFDAKQEKR